MTSHVNLLTRIRIPQKSNSHLVKVVQGARFLFIRSKMALYARKLVEQLKTPEFRTYLMSTHFWGPAANWGIPIAALADIQKDPKYISGKMTLALWKLSSNFIRADEIKASPMESHKDSAWN